MYTHYIYRGKESETTFCSDKEFISFLLVCIESAKEQDIEIHPLPDGAQILIYGKGNNLLHVFHEFNESDATRLYNKMRQYRNEVD